MEILSRKRLCSDENSYILQSKIHVSQKTLDLTDPNRMKEIYDKTINLLFKGSRDYSHSNLSKTEDFANLIVNGTGQIKFINDLKTFKKLKNSNCCNKLAFIESDCYNCNLNLCEHCGFSCVTLCGALLCSTCITLFECGTFEEPICRRCKYVM